MEKIMVQERCKTCGHKKEGELKIMTFGELLAMPIPPPVVTIDDDGWITIHGPYEYEIELIRCDSHFKIIDWVLHLSEKDWMTTDMINQFIDIALRSNGLKHPHGPEVK